MQTWLDTVPVGKYNKDINRHERVDEQLRNGQVVIKTMEELIAMEGSENLSC